jgi:hypothetical protein
MGVNSVMKFTIEMTDGDGGFIDLEVFSDSWEQACSLAEEMQPGWEVASIICNEPDAIRELLASPNVHIECGSLRAVWET